MAALIEIVAVFAVIAFAAWFVLSRSVGAQDETTRTRRRRCRGCAEASQCGTSPSRPSLPVIPVTFLLTLLTSASSFAADTVETWDPGATDIDFYMGVDGVGRSATERGVFGDMMIGFGATERFSVYLGTTLTAAGTLTDGEPTLYFGLFGTPVESTHMDLDFFLDISASGGDFGQLQLCPSLELNLDAADERTEYGAYVRVGAPIYGHTRVDPDTGRARNGSRFLVELNPGLYWTAAPDHQLFVEYDMLLVPARSGEQTHGEVGGVAVGYNVVLSPAIELVTQLYGDIPQQGEDWTVGVVTGFIATVPPTGG